MFFKLQLVQFEIKSILFDQFFVCAYFPDLPFIQYDDLICFADGRKAVGNDDGSPPGNQFVDGLLNQLFRFGVNGGCGLVQDKYGWIVKKRPYK